MSQRVVIADDEPNLVIPLEYMLKREGYDVTVARDGQEALDAVARVHPQLVLLDVMMPRKSGFDVCQVLRADEANRELKILLLTAKGRDDDVAKGLALGADAYMIKPFSPKELVLKVRELLGGAA
ncbi:response regulator transcription factor [Piscinibacter sp.]|jgi:two-component system alkaline phosphatase synthesis response regulator PhoP|uniref:response regulator transcription factor n=1 Tax=Piscinibacter sp. TaxID=1903157 RepID=UPI00355A90CA